MCDTICGMSDTCIDFVVHVVEPPIIHMLNDHDVSDNFDHNMSCMGTLPLCNLITNVPSISLCFGIKSHFSESDLNIHNVTSNVCHPSTDAVPSCLIENGDTSIRDADNCICIQIY